MTAAAKLAEKKAHAWSLIQAGRYDAAQIITRELCKADKRDPQSWYLFSLVLSQLKKYPEAIKGYKNTLRFAPDFIEANYNLARTYQLSGLHPDAINYFRKTLSLKASFADAHFGLGSCLHTLGHFKQAAESFKTTLDYQPSHINAKINLGIVLQNLGELDAAESALLSAIKQENSAIAYLQLGKLYRVRNEQQKTLNSLIKAVEHDPNLIDALHELAIIYFQTGHLPESQHYFESVLHLNNRHIDALVGMGSIKVLLGYCEEGLEFIEQALKLDKTHVNAAVLKAKTYEQMGKPDEALEALGPIIHGKVINAAAGAVFANICHGKKEYQDGIIYLETLRKHDKLNNWEQRQILFSLGKLYDAAKQYDKAFLHYKTANKLTPCSYSPDQNTHYTDQLIQAFSRQHFEALPRSTQCSERPVFIVGMPRSGTSLAEQILARHPQITGGGELTYMHTIASRMQIHTRLLPDSPNPISVDELNQAAAEYLEKTSELRADKTLLSDKLPANFQHLGLIKLLFPSAIVIHCQRNAIDTCLSCYFQDFIGDELGFTYNLDHLAHYYEQYQRLMQHWEVVLGIPMLNIHYERLVEDQEKTSRELVAFCGLEWDPRCLDFNKSNRFVRTVSYDQVRRPIYNSSVERWRNYQQFIGPLARFQPSNS